MNQQTTNSTRNVASGTGLRPACKPIRTHMSKAFICKFAKTNLVTLVNNLKRIFLRLGFDGYTGENTSEGFQIRLSGNNVNTGKYCNHHVVYRTAGVLPCAFSAKIMSYGNFYMLNLDLAEVPPLGEAV